MHSKTALGRTLLAFGLAAALWTTGCQQAGSPSATGSTAASQPSNPATAIPVVNKAQQVASVASGSVTQGLAVVHFGASW
jgi:hypothetical protein